MSFRRLVPLLLAAVAPVAHAEAPGRERGPTARAAPDEAEAKIDAFWIWWRTSSERLAAAVDSGRGASIAVELGAQVHAIDRRLAWETGPGLRGARHHLALSSEGDTELRVLAERWLARAPAADAAWEYYPARQAGPREVTLSLALRDAPTASVDLAKVTVGFESDPARELVHVTFHHPALSKLDEGQRTTAAFLVLDNLLGEDGVERWIGGVEISVGPLPEGKPLQALAAAVESLAREATGERFAVLEGRTAAGLPLVATVNLAVKRVDHLLMDHHLVVTIPLRAEASSGMPTSEEQRALNGLEDQLLESLARDAVYIGHETGEGKRTIHFHVAGRGPAEPRARAWARKHAKRRVEVALRYDPSWEMLRKWR